LLLDQGEQLQTPYDPALADLEMRSKVLHFAIPLALSFIFSDWDLCWQRLVVDIHDE
jgi:hypothetical protein